MAVHDSPSDSDRTVAHDASFAVADGGDIDRLPAGTRLGEFEVTGLVGEGGFSIVYEAWDHTLERRVALKEYMPSSLATRRNHSQVRARAGRHQETFQAGLKSFINEGKLLAHFDHPSLVKVYRFWEANGTAYMVMPLYEGVTLKETVQALPGPPDEGWLLTLLDPLTEALIAIHRDQCFHRDIAPDNVLLLKGDDRPLLLDFGAARRVIGDKTQALTVILKPGYAPVEQYAEDTAMRQGPWTDVYALASVVHWAILGRTPPVSVGRMMSDAYEPLVRVAAGRYSHRFLAAVDAALAVLPEKRTQTVAAFREALGLGRSGVPASRIQRPASDEERTVIRSATQVQREETTARDDDAATVLRPSPTPGKDFTTPNAAPRRGRRFAVFAGVGVAAAVVAVAVGWMTRDPATAPGTAAIPVDPSDKARDPSAGALKPERAAEISTATAPATPPSSAPPSTLTVEAPVPLSLETPRATVPRKPVPDTAAVHRDPTPVAAKPQAPKVAGDANSAECGRILQRLSLGESNPELIEKMRALRCH